MTQMSPQKQQNWVNSNNSNKRVYTHSQSTPLRPNKPLTAGPNDQQSSPNALKAAQMKSKRAKQLLVKKQNIKEVPIVKNPVPTQTTKRVDSDMEAAVGVDEDYKLKLEEQKRLREEILRKKEERRKAMAAQRLRDSENLKTGLPLNRGLNQLKTSPVRSQSQPQQQIATLLNRSPQLNPQPKQSAPKRIVKPIVSETIAKPVVNRVVIVNANQKRSVLIKGLASSTTELTIRKLCKPIGAIESCKIGTTGGTNQKSATVTFVRAQDALAFQTKYERTLLDLSIIQVSLIWFVFIHFFQSFPKVFSKQFYKYRFIEFKCLNG